jgi:hypothetical protein
VVLVSRRICIRSSSPEIAWLSALGHAELGGSARKAALTRHGDEESKSLRLRLAMLVSGPFINFTYKGH